MSYTRISAAAITVLISSAFRINAPASTEATELAPPAEYLLADVVLEHQYGSGYYGDEGVTLQVGGNGKGFRIERTHNGPTKTTEFIVAPSRVFELLELCYRERFFELSPSYGPPYRPRLGPNGAVSTMVTVVSHSASQVLTVRIGTFSKSVVYSPPLGSPPNVVLEVARRITELETPVPAK